MIYKVSNRRAVAIWGLMFHGVLILLAFASGVLLVPLYLKYIPTDLYGAWSASGNVLAWMSLVDPGVSAVLQQRVANIYGKQDYLGLGQWIGNGILISFVFSFIIALIGFAVSFFFVEWMHLPASIDADVLINAFRWAVFGTALMFFHYSLAAVWTGLQGSWGIALIFTSGSIVRLLAVIILLKSGFGLQALVLPNVLFAVLLIAGYIIGIGLRLRQDEINICLSLSRCKEMFGLFSFTSLANIASTVISQVDLLWIARVLGPEQVNVLRFMRTPTSMSRMFIDRPFLAVSAPLTHLYGSGGVDRARTVLVRMLRVAVWVIFLFVGGFLAYTQPFINLWVGSKYYAGFSVNGWIVSGYVISILTGILSSACFSAGNIKGNSLSAIVQAVVYIPMLLVLGHYWGMVGIVAATTLSIVLVQGIYQPLRFLHYYQVKRSEWLPLALEGLKAFCVAGVLVIVAQLGKPQTWLSLITHGLLFCGTYCALLLSVSIKARDESLNGYQVVQERVTKLLKRGG
jgi:O-antigen/teichoic acid export membrane protein